MGNTIRKVIKEAGAFTLSRHESRQTGRVHYTILNKGYYHNIPMTHNAVREFFDPQGIRGSRYGNTWKFKSSKEAEDFLLMAILKWGLK